MLGASPVVTRPRDTLTRAASDAVENQPRRRPRRPDARAVTSSRSARSARRARPTPSPVSSALVGTRPTSSRRTSPGAGPGTGCASDRSRASTPQRRTGRASRVASTSCRSSSRLRSERARSWHVPRRCARLVETDAGAARLTVVGDGARRGSVRSVRRSRLGRDGGSAREGAVGQAARGSRPCALARRIRTHETHVVLTTARPRS